MADHHMPGSPAAPQRLPSPWQRFRRWGAGWNTGPQIGYALAVMVVLVLLCAGIGIATSLGSRKTVSATATRAPVVQVSTTRVPLTPTPTGPHLLTDTTLGGTEEAFQATYGTPSGAGNDQTYPFPKGLVTATPALTASADGIAHVASVRVGPPSGSWDAPTATSICAQFLPPDAQSVNERQVAGRGLERIYTSADLAATFPAYAFTTATTGDPVAPGTLAMEVGPDFPLNTGCILILGE